MKENIIAVAGASPDTSKYWYRIFKDILAAGLTAYCVNPKVEEVEGNKIYPDLKSLPIKADTLIIVVRPDLAATLVDNAIALGFREIWFQPGTFNKEAAEKAKQNGLTVHESCFMVDNGIW